MENKQYTTRELFRRFAPYFKKYRFTLCMDLFCAALTTVCELVLPLIMRYITNEGLRDLAALSVKTIFTLGILYFGLRIVDCIAGYYMSDMGHVMGAKIETDMRRDAYNHLQKLSNTYYNNTKVGQIMGRITNDLFDVTEFAHHCPEEFFIAGIKTVISFVILANINLPLTLMIFLCVPLMCGVCMILNFRMRSAFRKQRNQIGELNARIEDSLLGHKVVKAFTNEEVENEKFEKDNGTFLDIKKLTYRYMAAFNTTVKLFDGLMYLVVLVAGGIFMVRGRIAAGDLVAYMLYVSTLIATIRRIIEFAEQFQRGMTGIERFAEIMDTPVAIQDAPDAVPLQPGPGEIRFEKVCFEYPDDHNKVLHHVSLDIKAGERLALVGPSGGGKTTLCNLIPRFYDVTSGHIYIDGQDIQQVTLKSLREDIGIVQQDVYLFSGSVADNIAYGKPDATREEIIEAARLAGAGEGFVQQQGIAPGPESAEQGRTALLPAGKVEGRLLQQLLRKAHHPGRFPHPAVDLLFIKPHVAGAEGNVLIHCLFKQLVLRILEHQPHLKAHLPDLLGVRPDVLAVEIDMPLRGLQQPVEMLDQRGFPGARVTDDP